MLMRIVRARAKPGKWPQFERKMFEESPDVQGVPGLRARWILHDLDDTEAVFVVALWDSEQHASSFERDAERHQSLMHPLPGEFEFHLCEIRSAWVATEYRGSTPISAQDSQVQTVPPTPPV